MMNATSKPVEEKGPLPRTTNNEQTVASNEPSLVQVHVRIRPLISQEEEQGHKCMDYQVIPSNDDSTRLRIQVPPRPNQQKSSHADPMGGTNPTNPNFPNLPPKLLASRQRGTWKNLDGFSSILEPDSHNWTVYQQTMQPWIRNLVPLEDHPHGNNSNSASVCVFTYGHTGSGKTHTLLGYEQHNDKQNHNLGIYKYAAQDLFAFLEQYTPPMMKAVTAGGTNDDKKQVDSKKLPLVLVQITELYNKDLCDLTSGERKDCTLRHDQQGVMRVRGPFVQDDCGRFEQPPLGKLCRSASEVMDVVDAACHSRRVGTSTHHDLSSRSHLVVELEVVTPELLEQRHVYAAQHAHLTRLGWLQTERRMGRANKDLPQWTDEYMEKPSRLNKDLRNYQALVEQSQQQLDALVQETPILGNTLVFCDLAGNEYAADADRTGSTVQEMEESAEINTSLLAVKELIRSLAARSNHSHGHVSSRNSKLSMMLKRHLCNKNNNNRAVMLGHISPSQEYCRKTMNTLTYCSMVAAAACQSTPSSSTTGGPRKMKKDTSSKQKHVATQNQAEVSASITTNNDENGKENHSAF